MSDQLVYGQLPEKWGFHWATGAKSSAAEQMSNQNIFLSGQRPMGLHAKKLSDEAVAESMRPLSDEDLGFWQDNDFPE